MGLFDMPGTGAINAAKEHLSDLAVTNQNLYQQYLPQLATRFDSLSTNGDPGLRLDESAALGNNAAMNQAAYKQAAASLNGRNLFNSNIPPSMMTQLSNENIARTGGIQTDYAKAQANAKMQALMQLLGLTQNAGQLAGSEWGTVGGIGQQQAAGGGGIFSALGNIAGMALSGGFSGTPGIVA